MRTFCPRKALKALDSGITKRNHAELSHLVFRLSSPEVGIVRYNIDPGSPCCTIVNGQYIATKQTGIKSDSGIKV